MSEYIKNRMNWSREYKPTGPAPENFKRLSCGYINPELKVKLKKEYNIKWYDEPTKGWYVGNHLHDEVITLCPAPKPPRTSWTRVDDIVPRDKIDELKSLLGPDLGWAPVVNPDSMPKVREYLA